MPLLQVALIVSARRELILSAGEAPAGAPGGASFELTQESIQTLDGPAFLKVGLTQTGAVNVRGAEVVDPADPGSSLEIGWYLPPEEGPEDARPVELSGVTVLPSALSRSGAEPGHVWHFRVDGRGPFTETMYFDSGFLPPFRPSDVTLGLTDISAYGYQTMLLTELRYCSRAPIFTDGDWGIPQTIVQGFLED